jgi:peroxiredoxin
MLTSARQIEEEATWAPAESRLVHSLIGLPLPSLRLPSTTGGELNLAMLTTQPVVVYVHPGTETLYEVPEDPDGLLASGCTVQSRVFREHAPRFAARRFQVLGISGSEPCAQRLFARRERLVFPLLSDSRLELAEAIDLPTTLTADGERVYSRLTFVAHEGVIDTVFYPVPIPRRNAIDVLAWLAKQGTVL